MSGRSARLVQPDARSCGAACLIVASGHADPATWDDDVRRTHREVTALRDGGRWALPWPRALGTPPWAVARRLGLTTGRRWRAARPDLAAVTAVVRSGTPVPLYVGSRLLPRHVLLATALDPDGTTDALLVYDPARGAVRPLADALRTGWPRLWCAVLPRSGPATGLDQSTSS